MNVWLYEDDSEAPDWVARAKTAYRAWAKKVPKIQEVIVSNGAEFSALLKGANDELPDLMVIDLEIDGDDSAGVEAIRHLRQHGAEADIPIVVFSSNGTRVARDDAYEAGATSYVKKPAVQSRRVEALADIFGYWLELHQPR